jgi:large subunit ribosomal protein L15
VRLGALRPNTGAVKRRKRLGKGRGTGHGGTSTKGSKGQKARSGGRVHRWFEGGQMPLQRRTPKVGFVNFTRKKIQIVNVSDLNRFDEGQEITAERLKEKRLIQKLGLPVKLLGDGKIEKAFTVKVDAASASAREKIEKAGGKLTLSHV